ncbi:mucin TcMUCII [Trypanosoma cruzi]|nr:mucin TcMUCII [Trypanosoma cruzi]
MTCRLLCALLVLALCCCPLVCATAANEDTAGNSGEHSGPTKPKSEVANQVTQLPSKTPSPPKTGEGEIGTAEPQGDLNQGQEKDENSTEEETDRDETNNAKDQNQKTNAINTTTTTTTTKAPTTTTAAPEPPTATTTEAPTTTTTRAPSRLREIDGSLSSSA